MFSLGVVTLFTTILLGCELFAVEKTYNYSVMGICVEITTSDSDMKRAAENAGYDEGQCSSNGTVGTCQDYVVVGGESFDAVFYESTYSASIGEYSCELLGGTWVVD